MHRLAVVFFFFSGRRVDSAIDLVGWYLFVDFVQGGVLMVRVMMAARFKGSWRGWWCSGQKLV